MTQTYEFSLQDHFILMDSLETRIQRIDKLLHDWKGEGDSTTLKLVAEYEAERQLVQAMLERFNTGFFAF